MTTKTYTSLRDCLNDFQIRFNDSAMVKKLIKNWNRSVVLEATDSGAVLTLMISNFTMTEVRDQAHEDPEYPICLQAAQEILIKIFSGESNPTHALIDGTLAVFSSEKDKVKLEAIAMVIWGLT